MTDTAPHAAEGGKQRNHDHKGHDKDKDKAKDKDGAKPIGYVERDWGAERFTGGCHGAHFAPGVWTANGPLLAQDEGVLHWAGAEYASRFNGYLEGAVRSGREAATRVTRSLA